MTKTSCERCRFPGPIRWLHAGDDLAQPSGIHQCAHRALVRSERPPKSLMHSTELPYVTDTQADFCQRHVYHRGRRRHQIPIALAARSVPNFPRLRALALFGRRLAERAECLVIAGVQKPAQSTEGDITPLSDNHGSGSRSFRQTCQSYCCGVGTV